MVWHKWQNDIWEYHFFLEENCLKREMVILRLLDTRDAYRNFLLCEQMLDQVTRERERITA